MLNCCSMNNEDTINSEIIYRKNFYDIARDFRANCVDRQFSCPGFSKAVLSINLDSKIFQIGSNIKEACKILYLISGQKSTVVLAKKSVSNFKIRKGFKVGCKVTLRKKVMYEFLERLCRIYLPRIRSFSGLRTKSVSGGGISFGIGDISAFIELPSNLIMSRIGVGIAISIRAVDNITQFSKQEIINFLKYFNFPMKA